MASYWSNSQQKQLHNVQTRATVAIKKMLDDANITILYLIRTLYYCDREKYSDYILTDREGVD